MICKKCVMDDVADPFISFDSEGISNYWHDAMQTKKLEYFPNEEGEKKLEQQIALIKEKGKNKKYDCIIGLSGGLDSSYLALLAKKHGLRMLGVHFNDGFDEPIGTENVKKITEYCNIDLYDIPVDIDQYYSVIRAYLNAGVPNLAAPQDNLITSCILRIARENGIKFFLSGVNFSLEGVLQKGNTITNRDKKNIIDIYRKCGEGGPISNLVFDSPFKRDMYYKVYGIKTCALLNYIDYNMKRAIEELSSACGFSYYGGKHYENRFTRFVQQIWLVERFKVDKRKSHYSSLIASGQMTRDEALALLIKPVIEDKERESIICDLAKRLHLDEKYIIGLLNKHGVQHDVFKTSRYLSFKKAIKTII